MQIVLTSVDLSQAPREVSDWIYRHLLNEAYDGPNAELAELAEPAEPAEPADSLANAPSPDEPNVIEKAKAASAARKAKAAAKKAEATGTDDGPVVDMASILNTAKAFILETKGNEAKLAKILNDLDIPKVRSCPKSKYAALLARIATGA